MQRFHRSEQMKVFARLASMRAPFIALALIAATSVSGCSGNNTKSAENFNPDVSQGPGVNQSPEHHSDPSTEAPDKRGHQKEPEPDLPGCELAHEWQTVDYFRIESPRLDATAASIASTSYRPVRISLDCAPFSRQRRLMAYS
jgi:hypothetical protein